MTSLTLTRKLLFAGCAAFAVTGCTQGNGQETFGTLLGAALGGWLGSEIDDDGVGGAVAIATGTFVGGAIGGSIGRNMDDVDRIKAAQAQQLALEVGLSGQAQQWYNPDTGNYGSIVPQPAYQTTAGQFCREYQQRIFVGGQQVEGYGTACRQPDGAWKIIS
ncbi:MAG: RT0821/Lpp0805 family surface protein [Pseudomonadota bacterium]